MKKFFYQINKKLEEKNKKIGETIESAKLNIEAKLSNPTISKTAICFHNQSGTQDVTQNSAQMQRENGNMYESMTASLNQYTENINQFQENERPIFEKVYVRLRKLLFDFFGTTIEVL